MHCLHVCDSIALVHPRNRRDGWEHFNGLVSSVYCITHKPDGPAPDGVIPIALRDTSDVSYCLEGGLFCDYYVIKMAVVFDRFEKYSVADST